MNKPIVRCSELPQLLRCPGSRPLKRLVTPRSGVEGWDGTVAHWETAWRIVKELGADQPDGGIPLPQVPAGYKLPRFNEWLIGFFFNHARFSYPRDWALTVELPLIYEFDRFFLSGHQDLHGVNADATACRGSDWKCVRNILPAAADNDQILGYTCQNAMAYPNLDYAAFDLVQPFADEEEGEIPKVSTVELDKNGIQDALARLNDRVNYALDHEMEIENGIKQCAFCDAAMQCPCTLKELDDMKMTLTPEMMAKIRKEPDDALLGDIAVARKILTRPLDDAHDLLKERITANGEVVAGNGTRITAKVTNGSFKIVDPVGMYQECRRLIPNEAILAKALGYPMGRLTDAIAEEMNIPRGGTKAPLTAEGIAKASLHPHAEQGTRMTLQYQ